MNKAIEFDWSKLTEDQIENINFFCPYCYGAEEITVEKYKELDKEQQEGFDKHNEDSYYCQHCSEGYLEPIYNYKYPIDCEFTEDNRKKALKYGLFLFEDQDNVFMSLMECEMDLSQNIGMAYLDITGRIPYEWAIDISLQEGLNVSGEKYKRLLEGIKESVEASDYRNERLLNEVFRKLNKKIKVKEVN